MNNINVKIFFDESGKKTDRPTIMGGLLIPNTVYENSDFRNLTKRLSEQEFKLHWTRYNGYSKEKDVIKEVINTFTIFSSLTSFNIINYIKPDRIPQSHFDNMVYSKLPERIIYGLLRYKGVDSISNADIYIEKATEYEQRDLKDLIKNQLDIQSIYRGEKFKVVKCGYYTKNTQIGLEITDLILGFIRTIINNDTGDISKSKKAKNDLVIELFKDSSFYQFMSNINYYEWTSSSKLNQIDFDNYIKVFLSSSEKWLDYLRKNK